MDAPASHSYMIVQAVLFIILSINVIKCCKDTHFHRKMSGFSEKISIFAAIRVSTIQFNNYQT